MTISNFTRQNDRSADLPAERCTTDRTETDLRTGHKVNTPFGTRRRNQQTGDQILADKMYPFRTVCAP